MTISCAAFEELADELALGTLTGNDRALALAHVDECHACRAELASLTEAADELLLLAPRVSPDEGFTDSVLAAIPHPIEVRPRRHRLRAVLAIAAALVAIALAGVFGFSDHGSAPSAQMQTASGTVVGTVSLHGHGPTSVDMRLPGWAALARSYGTRAGAPFWLELDGRDGRHQRIALDGRDAGSWDVVTAASERTISSVSVVDEHGVVWCSARFA